MKKYIFSIAVLLSGTALVCFPEKASQAVKEAVLSCMNVIIPSLFAMMVLSELFISSGLYKAAGRPFGIIGRYIFRIPSDMGAVFLVSMAAGYPVGASLIVQAYDKKSVSREDAENMLCWCFGAGPAFIFSAVGLEVFGNKGCGAAVFISCIAANVIIGILCGIGKKMPEKSSGKTELCFSSSMITEAVCKGGVSLMKMCAVILFMSALLSIPEALGVTVHISSVLGNIFHTDPYDIYISIRSMTDITKLTAYKTNSVSFLPTAAALVSFGGISVFMQIASVCKGRIGISKMIISRFAAAFLSYIICDRLYGILYREAYISVMSDGDISIRHNPPLSSLFLLIMTILLLSQKQYGQNEKNVI